MDHNRIPSQKKYQYLPDPHLLIRRTLHFILPVSLASFLVSYTCTSFSSYPFTALVFPFFTHVFERKYMFLICNGILAFLMKTLNFNNNKSSSSSYSLSDLDDHIDSSLTVPRLSSFSESFQQDSAGHEEGIRHAAPRVEEDALMYEDPVEDEVVEDFIVESEGFDMESDVIIEDDHEEVVGDFIVESEGFDMESDVIIEDDHGEVVGDFIVESEGFGLESDVIIDDEEENMEDEYLGGGALMGGDQHDQTEVMNMNTEELNQKFEDFIRKMKEELRIEQQQYQLIAV